MNKRKELIVSALKNGTVIDHITEGNVMAVKKALLK
jgi:aspartate carbamoyltransferase regulatory subunit